MDLGKNTDEIDEVPPIPDWVLDNCVKTLSELARLETRIVLRDGHLEEKTTLQDNKYEMLSCMYQDLLDLVSPPFDVNVKVTLTSNTETTPKQGCFTNDGVILRLPGDNGTSPGFFLAVIEHFARDIGADMVKLSIQDIDALSDCLLEHQVNKRKTLIPAIKPENQSPKATQNQGDLKDDDPSKKRELADESEAETISRDQSPSDTPGSETPSQPDFGSPNNSDCNDPKTKADAPQGSPDVEPGGASNEKSNSAKQSNNNSSKDQKWSKHNPKTTIEDSKEEDTDNDERSIGSSSSDSGSEYTIPPTVVFYRQIIARLQEKRLQEQEQDGNSTQQKPLLIIVILEVFGVVSQSPSTLSHLRECINSPPGDHTVLLIATDQTASSRCPPPPPPLPPPPPPQSHHMYSLPLPSSRPPPSPSRDSRTLCMFSHNPVREAIEIVPLWSPSQKHLFSQEKEADIVASNIWTLQREVKRLVSKKDAPILQPYNGWKLQSGSDSEKFLKQSQLSDQKSRSIATRIAKDFSVVDLDELVANELGRVEARTKAIDKWNEGNEGNSESSNKWSRLPPHVYKAVKQIEGDPQKFKREIGLLDNVVDPGKCMFIAPTDLIANFQRYRRRNLGRYCTPTQNQDLHQSIGFPCSLQRKISRDSQNISYRRCDSIRPPGNRQNTTGTCIVKRITRSNDPSVFCRDGTQMDWRDSQINQGAFQFGKITFTLYYLHRRSRLTLSRPGFS